MADETKHEIVIVRRAHGDHDDGHHGGVWKIAFADFMTAMMCFFLVMWLINASNEQTKAAVASYFNPVKLVDRNAGSKGLEDSEAGAETSGQSGEQVGSESTTEAQSGPALNEGTVESSQMRKEAEEKLFSDPYAVLAEIASETGRLQNISRSGEGGASTAGPATGASGGEAYRDPFAPDFWSQQVALPTPAESSAEPERTAQPGDSTDVAAVRQASEPAFPPSPAEREAIPDAVLELSPADADPFAAAAPPAPPGPAPERPVAERPVPGLPDAKTIEAADRIRAELAKELLPEDKIGKGISVVPTDKGVVVSVTDQLEFGMFEIGSAVPRRELVLAMEKIGAAVSKQNGVVTVAGHTDARPYRDANYDNWRLSTSRAHSAYYMLVRGGLDEQRIVEVAGFADRKPKDPADPLAAINRRIEILLQIPQ
jgi:chemotaxis protein MotB